MTKKEKKKIRDMIRSRRGQLAPAWVRNMSARAQELIMDLKEWKRAEAVFCYLARGDEVHTDMLIHACRQESKRVFVPAYHREASRYEPVCYEGGELIAGYGGISEPARPEWLDCLSEDDNNDPVAGKSFSIPLAIVPGVAFDRVGNRLGHGRGHYDELLKLMLLQKAFKIGLAFEFQMFDAVPADLHDIPMDAVVTENNIYISR